METEKRDRLYIVSFGDSRQYRLEFVDSSEGDVYNRPTPLASAERELNQYLREKFPGETFAYYTSPRVVEIAWEHRDQYTSYPELDAKAIEDIKEVLVKEVEDMRDTRLLNINAPYSDTTNKAV